MAGIEITPRTRLLDVGCGVGDLARWCAHNFGCEVVGITPVRRHAALAAARAEHASVSHLCTYAVMDMNALAFDDDTFDVVVNQESLCYASDATAYLTSVNRILREGGTWTAIAFSRADALEAATDQLAYQQTLAGFCIPRLCPPSEISSALRRAGFGDRRSADLTAFVRPTARSIVAEAIRFECLTAVGAQWMIEGEASSPEHHRGHFTAGRAYSEGLLTGWARHMQYRATGSPSS